MILSSHILQYLDSPQRFQSLCFYLARKSFAGSIPVLQATDDQGMDVVQFGLAEGDTVLQCKYFAKRLGSAQRLQIQKSLEALSVKQPIYRWVLCLPVNPSGRFLNWLRKEVREICPQVQNIGVWGADTLIAMLNEHVDVRDQFFFPLYQEFARSFRTDELELLNFRTAEDCVGWKQESNTLIFLGAADRHGDLIFDVIVRNTGTVATALTALTLEVADVRRLLRGLPGARVLVALATYDLSLRHGTSGMQNIPMEPPIEIGAGSVGRFKVRLTDGGFAWTASARITVAYGHGRSLELPWVRISV